MDTRNSPPRPSADGPLGDGAALRFFQAVWDKLFGTESRFIDTPTVKVRQTSRGIYLDAAQNISRSGTENIRFKITQSTDWLTYRVGDGDIITTGEEFQPTGQNEDMIVDSNVRRYWFYIAMTATTASIEATDVPPTWDTNNIPIGYVDTETRLADEIGIIYQHLRDDIFVPCATG